MKYLVIKTDDIETYLNDEEKLLFGWLTEQINNRAAAAGSPSPEYEVTEVHDGEVQDRKDGR